MFPLFMLIVQLKVWQITLLRWELITVSQESSSFDFRYRPFDCILDGGDV